MRSFHQDVIILAVSGRIHLTIWADFISPIHHMKLGLLLEPLMCSANAWNRAVQCAPDGLGRACPLQSLVPRASYFTSLCFCFLIWKNKHRQKRPMIILQGCCGSEIVYVGKAPEHCLMQAECRGRVLLFLSLSCASEKIVKFLIIPHTCLPACVSFFFLPSFFFSFSLFLPLVI